MKKSLLLLFIAIAPVLQAKNEIYLENQSSGPIGVKIDNKQEAYLNRNVRMKVGVIQKKPGSTLMFSNIDSFNVRSLGKLWSGAYTSLDNYLNMIEAQAMVSCSSNQAPCNYDAVLIVNPSVYGWNVSLQWEEPSDVQSFEMSDFASNGPKKDHSTRDILTLLKRYVENGEYTKAEALVKMYEKQLSTVLNGPKLKAIVTGAHPGADANQKEAAIRFINQVL